MSLRLTAAALALSLVAATPAVTSFVPPGHDKAPGLDVLVRGELRDAARHFEERAADHLIEGQVWDLVFATAEQDPDELVAITGTDTVGLFTGVYLAAESFRYAVARKAATTAAAPGHRRQAEREQAAAKDRVDQLVHGLYRNVDMAKVWRGGEAHLNPANDVPPEAWDVIGDDVPLEPDGERRSLGGVVEGERGLPFRACLTSDVWERLVGHYGNRTFGPFVWDDGQTYTCQDATSRDVYAGMVYGMAWAFDLVGPDDPALQQRVGSDLVAMADYLVRHHWSAVRPHGNIVLPWEKSPDMENVAYPNFLINPLARLNLVQTARHVVGKIGTAQEQAYWDAVHAFESTYNGPNLTTEQLVNQSAPHDSYYKFNLDHMNSSTVLRLEKDPSTYDVLAQGVAVMDASTRDDVNAHFESITFGLTGELDRRDDAVTHLQQWLVHRQHAGSAVTNSARCGDEIDCVDEGYVDYQMASPAGTVGAQIALVGDKQRARHPLPVTARAYDNFMWHRSPFILDGGARPTIEYSALDFLLPYWTLRYFTEVAPPALRPFPAWDATTTGNGAPTFVEAPLLCVEEEPSFNGAPVWVAENGSRTC